MADASYGDRSYIFQKCLRDCKKTNCTEDERFYQEQPLAEWLLQWTCPEECSYRCMWSTVDAFRKDGLEVPQFHGKWPFIRVFGIQEPASVVFSLLNGLCHLRIFTLRAQVPSRTPMFYVWHGLALVGFHAWMWAAIFHSRDTYFTEVMDYFCAFSLVLYNVFTLYCRILGTSPLWRPLTCGVVLVAVFIQHTCYLAFVNFDYGYNMQVNAGIGFTNVIGWIIWSFLHYKRQRYVWKCVVTVVVINALIALELGDFAPLWWTFDAHSLWHAGTVSLGWLWYSFIIDDSVYVLKQMSKKKS
ncbi:hypothetical protein ScPMuIL_015037 [Solemya velum]